MPRGAVTGSREEAADQKWTVLGLLVLLVALVDQGTKELVRATFAPGEQGELLGLSVHHVRNPGIVGGALEETALPLALLAIAFVAWVYAYLARTRGARPGLILGFGLILGGGIGNLVDRVRLGWVTDFIRNEDRAYNVADVAIFAGGWIVILALLLSLVLPRRPTA